jgi:hypothetical protein
VQVPERPLRRTFAGRIGQELYYVVFGTRQTKRWRDGHGCVPSPHDHDRCTHLVCDDLDCALGDCHVVVVPKGGTVAYEWYHHPLWRNEVVERRRRIAAGGLTVSQHRRALFTRGFSRPRRDA